MVKNFFLQFYAENICLLKPVGYPHSNAYLRLFIVKICICLKLEHCKPHVIQRNVTSLMSNYFLQYIADILSQISNVIQSEVGLR